MQADHNANLARQKYCSDILPDLDGQIKMKTRMDEGVNVGGRTDEKVKRGRTNENDGKTQVKMYKNNQYDKLKTKFYNSSI